MDGIFAAAVYLETPFSMILHIYFQVCHVLKILCDAQLRSRIEQLVLFSEEFVVDCQKVCNYTHLYIHTDLANFVAPQPLLPLSFYPLHYAVNCLQW